MMEKAVQRQILAIIDTVQQGLKTATPKAYREFAEAVNVIKDLCRKNLPKERNIYYNEVFSELILALEQVAAIGDAAQRQSLVTLCGELLTQTGKELKKEAKKDIVFLPYKVSMWDSLESIWQAAVEDKEHCNAYVIAIPYADRNPDMTVAEWHCEKNLFPDYVPVLDWRTVDLKEMHPDIIFFHNPYDDFNVLTSVDSHYYSRNLKFCTDKLVYVPYFVVGDTIDEHFCQAPGIVNADYVIVQSEEIKEQYERYYPGGNPPKGKFLALGSPKFDKVLSSNKEDFVLPEEWQRLIGNKKVILYNTSLNAMLQNSDKVCAKLRYVFDVFKNRDDVVLWWRPHPLMRAAFHGMRPEIEAEYRAIEQAYINEGWGIYDDSPELHRAIAWSDAYYGDGSSVVWLYRVTGKPVMIESIFVDSVHNKNILHVRDFARHNDDLYFMPCNENAIFKYSIISGLSTRICIDNGNRGNLPYIYNGSVLKVGNYLVFAPTYKADVILFNIVNSSVERIKVKDAYWKKALSYKDEIFMFADGGVGAIKIDLFDKGVCLLDEFIDIKIKSYLNLCQVGQYVYIPVEKDDTIIRYDLDSRELLYFTVGSLGMKYATITFDGSAYWLTGTKPYIVEWRPLNGDNDNVTVHKIPSECVHEKYRYNNDLFSMGLVMGSCILLAPVKANGIIKFDKNNVAETMDRIVPTPPSSRCLNISVWDEHFLFALFEGYTGAYIKAIVFDTDGNLSATDPFRVADLDGLAEYQAESPYRPLETLLGCCKNQVTSPDGVNTVGDSILQKIT